MASKLSRIERDLAELNELAERREAPPPRRREREAVPHEPAPALGISHKTAPRRAARARRAARGPAPECLARPRRATVDQRGGRDLDLQPHRGLPRGRRPGRRRDAPCWARCRARAGIRPTELAEGIYAPRNCDAARHLYRVTSGLESMVVGEAEVQGQVRRAYEAALAARVDRAADQPAVQRRAAHRQARAHRDRDRRRPRLGAVGRRRRSPATRSATSRDRHVVIIGAGETSELTARALPRRASRRCSSPTATPPARGRAGRALRRRHGAARRAARASSRRPTSSSPPPPRRTRSSAPTSSRSSCGRAAAARCSSSTSPCRATSTRRAPRSTGVTLYDVDDLQRQVARNHRMRARPRRAAPRRSSRRRSSASPAGSGRSRCCRRSPRCARTPRASSSRARRERRALGVGVRRATARASRRCPRVVSTACCTSRPST